MKITLILEDRTKFIKEKYIQRVLLRFEELEEGKYTEESAWEAMLEVDGTPRNRFLQWVVRQFINNTTLTSNQMFVEWSANLRKTLNVFNQLRQSGSDKIKGIDPNALSAEEFVETMHEIIQGQEAIKAKIASWEANKDIETVYQDETIQALALNTFEASCHFGTGTSWCTADANNPLTFEQHKGAGPLIFLQDKQTKRRKYLLWATSPEHGFEYQFKDRTDSDKSLSLITSNPGLTRAIKEYHPAFSRLFDRINVIENIEDSSDIEELDRILQGELDVWGDNLVEGDQGRAYDLQQSLLLTLLRSPLIAEKVTDRLWDLADLDNMDESLNTYMPRGVIFAALANRGVFQQKHDRTIFKKITSAKYQAHWVQLAVHNGTTTKTTAEAALERAQQMRFSYFGINNGDSAIATLEEIMKRRRTQNKFQSFTN